MFITDKLIYRLHKIRRYAMWISLNKRCTYCGAPTTLSNITIDHMTPIRSGGSDLTRNIYPACKPCNNLKGSLSVKNFAKLTINTTRSFYFQSGEPIDVVRARLWIKLYGLLLGKYRTMYVSSARRNLIKQGVIKPK